MLSFRSLIRCAVLMLCLGLPAMGRAGLVATFDDLTLSPESYYNGADGAGGFASGGFSFNNSYDPVWGTWAGWAYSNTTDTTTAGSSRNVNRRARRDRSAMAPKNSGGGGAQARGRAAAFIRGPGPRRLRARWGGWPGIRRTVRRCSRARAPRTRRTDRPLQG